MDTFYDAQGNPAYTVKEGGTLKKRLQPFSVTKTTRDFLP